MHASGVGSMHVCARAWKSSSVLLCLFLFLKHGLTLNLELFVWTGWPTSKRGLNSSVWAVSMCHVPRFYLDAGDQNLGLHACETNTLIS